MPSFQDSSPTGGLLDPQPFACIRCWKQKKKCDRLNPSCTRCSLSRRDCVYSSNPPTERDSAEGTLPISPPEDGIQVTVRHQQPTTSQVILNVTGTLQQLPSHSVTRQWRHQFISPATTPLGTLLASIKENIHETCTLYLNTINNWMPVLIDAQLQDQLLKFQTHPDPEMTLLILSIYLVTHTPVQVSERSTDTNLLYTTLKSLYAESVSTTRPSIPIIQAGILISTFEYGQGWDQTSYLSIGTCARMGHVLNLHKTLSQAAPADSTSCAAIETHRHVWWSIVIVERLLGVQDLDSDRPFAAKDPSFYDLLPSFQGRGIYVPQQLGKASQADSASSNDPPKLDFPDTNSYARSAQATYLLSRVINHVQCKQSIKAHQAEVELLDNSLSSFRVSIFAQANRETELGWGHSCGAYLIANRALFTLHLHNFCLYKNSNSSNSPEDSQSISLLVLKSLTRVAIDTARTKLDDLIVGAKYVPPYMFNVMFDSAKFLIQNNYYGEDVAGWIADLDVLCGYLAVTRTKWNIAGIFLDELMSLPGYPHNMS